MKPIIYKLRKFERILDDKGIANSDVLIYPNRCYKTKGVKKLAGNLTSRAMDVLKYSSHFSYDNEEL